MTLSISLQLILVILVVGGVTEFSSSNVTIQVLGLKFVKIAGPIIFPDLPVTVTTSPGCKFLKILHTPPEQPNKLHKNKFIPPLNNILYHMKVCRMMCRQVTFKREKI